MHILKRKLERVSQGLEDELGRGTKMPSEMEITLCKHPTTVTVVSLGVGNSFSC